jgi:hypothetical protein
MQYQLRISGKHYEALKAHLFPGDEKEAVAVALCGRHEHETLSILLVHEVQLIPHEECERDEDFIRWKTDRIIPLLERAEKNNLGILKIHSHPGGFSQFSQIDDKSDHEFFSSVFGWCDSDSVHGSAVLLPNGELFARVFDPSLKHFKVDKISIAGAEISIWQDLEFTPDEFSKRTVQAFGEGTYAKVKGLKAGVIGVSGTGSPTIEQLTRLGIGKLLLIDSDKVEKKNLNRILNSTLSDAENGRYKVDVLKDAINKFGLGTEVTTYSSNIYNSHEALLELITCDVIFGCVDSVDGRHLLNQISNFYLIPYFDIGVRLDADGKGGIDNICASVHYLQAGRSSLLSRGVYTSKRLFDDGLLRQDPIEFAKREKQGYVHNANVDRPAVISINMQISSMALNDFLNRLHPFRDDLASNYARITMDYIWNCIENTSEDSFPVDNYNLKWAGYGDCKPFLRMPELSR